MEEIKSDTPKYQLTEKAYIDDIMYDPETTRLNDEGERQPLYIYFKGVPGPHMIPANKAAEAMCAKHKGVMAAQDPIRTLTVVGPEAQVLQPVHNR